MTETTELNHSIMYLACSIHEGKVRDCKYCPNKHDCEIKDKKKRLTNADFLLLLGISMLITVLIIIGAILIGGVV